MKTMIVLRILTGFLIVSTFNQMYAASRQIKVSPAGCREQADKLLADVGVYGKRKFRTNQTRHDFEMKLYRNFDKMLAEMEPLGEGTDWQKRIQALRQECVLAALEQLNVARLTELTQKISKAMIELEEEMAPKTEAADVQHNSDRRAKLRKAMGLPSESVKPSADEARAQLAQALLGLQEFMDINSDSEVAQDKFERLSALAQRALELIDVITDDMPLQDSHTKELMQIHKQISEKLGVQRGMSPQVAAKVTVFVVQGLLQVASILAIEVNRLALAERPEIVVQRASYRKWGVCAVVTAMALSAVLIAGNAAGIIDIQIVPAIADIVGALPNLLAV